MIEPSSDYVYQVGSTNLGMGPKPLSKSKCRQLVKLLNSPEEWIIRRVESLRFLEDGSTTRRISFDFELLPEFKELGWVPLALFQKRSLRALNVSSSDGTALSVLTTAENAELSISILEAGLREKPNQKVRKLLEDIVYPPSIDSDFDSIRDVEVMCTEYRDLLGDDLWSAYSRLSIQLAVAFIFWVQIPADFSRNTRCIVKVSYEEDLPLSQRLKPAPIETEIQLNWCSRFHFEVVAPLPLKVKELYLFSKISERKEKRPIRDKRIQGSRRSSGDRDVVVFGDIAEGSLQVAHVSTDGMASATSTFAWIQIVASKSGIPKIANLAAVATFCLFFFPSLFKLLGFHFFSVPAESSSASLLLLGPAMLVTYLARPSEHPIVLDRLTGARYSLVFTGILLMSASAVLGRVLGEFSVYLAWWALSVVSALGLYGIFSWRESNTA